MRKEVVELDFPWQDPNAQSLLKWFTPTQFNPTGYTLIFHQLEDPRL